MEIPKLNGELDLDAMAEIMVIDILLSEKPRKEIEVYVKGVLEDLLDALLEDTKTMIKEICEDVNRRKEITNG